MRPMMKLFMRFCHPRRHHRSATNGFKFRPALVDPRMNVDGTTHTTPFRHGFLTGPKWTGFWDLGHLDVEWYTVYMYTVYIRANRCMLSISRFGVPHGFFCYPYHLSGDYIDSCCQTYVFFQHGKNPTILKKNSNSLTKKTLKQFGHLSIMTPKWPPWVP